MTAAREGGKQKEGKSNNGKGETKQLRTGKKLKRGEDGREWHSERNSKAD
jgi:hypothetical protein